MKVSIDVPKEFLEETPAELKVSPETKKIWAVQIDLLAIIDRICRKHNLRYSVDSGTLIGTVRHGGMVPWDDDIDVVMPRADYERFCEIVPGEIDEPYFLQTAENDRRYYRGFVRLRNVATTGAFASEMIDKKLYQDYNQGIFVDVFPADNVPDDENERQDFFRQTLRLKGRLWRMKDCRNRFVFRCFFGKRQMISSEFLYGAWLTFLEKFFRRDPIGQAYREFISTCRKYERSSTKCVSPVAHRPYEVLDMKDFDDLADYDFEFIKVRGFRDYDRILSKQYGDWRKHVICIKDPMFFDVDHPYEYHLHPKVVRK